MGAPAVLWSCTRRADLIDTILVSLLCVDCETLAIRQESSEPCNDDVRAIHIPTNKQTAQRCSDVD